MVVRMPQLWSSHHCCGSWVVITILLKMVNAKDGGLLWDNPSFQLTEVRHGSNTYLFLEDYIYFFFMYQWGSPTLGGVLVKLSRWEFQLPLTPASSCGGCFVWYRWRHTYRPTYSTQRGVLQLWAFRLQFTYGPKWQLTLVNSHEGSHGSNGVWIVVVV